MNQFYQQTKRKLIYNFRFLEGEKTMQRIPNSILGPNWDQNIRNGVYGNPLKTIKYEEKHDPKISTQRARVQLSGERFVFYKS